MPEYTPSARAMFTDIFASDDIEHTARRTGCVKRASKMTGKIFLALITFGVWSDAKTTLAPLAATVTQLGEQLEVSPEALHQRMNKRALAFLQEMIRQALAKVQALENVCEDGLFVSCTGCDRSIPKNSMVGIHFPRNFASYKKFNSLCKTMA